MVLLELESTFYRFWPYIYSDSQQTTVALSTDHTEKR
jgi:hypothetical protein